MAEARRRPGNLIIIANSGRWLAESASKAGYRCYVMDAYGDQDTRSASYGWLALDKTRVRDILPLVAEWQLDPKNTAVVIGAGLEDSPDVLEQISTVYPLAGNSASIFRRINSPQEFFAVLTRLDIPYPAISWQRPDDCSSWLVKLAGSCGGQGVRPASIHAGVDGYYQRAVSGMPLSCLFIADGLDYRIIGCQQQRSIRLSCALPHVFEGVETFPGLRASWKPTLKAYVQDLVRAFALKGINSLDTILDEHGKIHVLEVNARPSVSSVLYDADFDKGIMHAHMAAVNGILPHAHRAEYTLIRGYRVCYATEDCVIPSGIVWPEWVSDRPQPGTQVLAGTPACSVNAISDTETSLEQILTDRCRQIKLELS